MSVKGPVWVMAVGCAIGAREVARPDIADVRLCRLFHRFCVLLAAHGPERRDATIQCIEVIDNGRVVCFCKLIPGLEPCWRIYLVSALVLFACCRVRL